MEFKFNVNDIFRAPIVEISQSLIPPGFAGDRRALWDAVTKVSEVVDSMGDASAAAQGLTKPITTADRLRNAEQTIYLLVDKNAKNGKGVVTGMLKTGKKSLYVFDREGQHYQVSPPCVLDFYVHESRQRTGLGKQLFEHMLQKEQVEPIKLAVDRPSEKLLSFLNKHYGLNNALRQMNNYVVFDGFFPEIKTKDLNGDTSNSNSPSKTKANGLQQNFASSPYGRYGAPRPPCSMGQIIHNQSPVQSSEPSGLSLRLKSPRPHMSVTQSTPVMQQNYSTQPQTNVCQSAPNVWHQVNPNSGQQMQYYGQPNAMQPQQQQLYMQHQPEMVQQPSMQHQPVMVQQPTVQQQQTMNQQPINMQHQPVMVHQPPVQQQQAMVQQPHLQHQPAMVQQPNIQQQPAYIQQPSVMQHHMSSPYMSELHQQQLQLNMHRTQSQRNRNGMSPRLDPAAVAAEGQGFDYVKDPYEQLPETQLNNQIASAPNMQLQPNIQQPPTPRTASTPRYNVQHYTQPVQEQQQNVPQVVHTMQQSVPNVPAQHQPAYPIQQQSTPALQLNQSANAPCAQFQQYIPPPTEPMQIGANQNYGQAQTNMQSVKTTPSTPRIAYQYYDSSAGVMQTQYTNPASPHIAANTPNPNAAGDMPPLQKSPEHYGQQNNMNHPATGQMISPSQMQAQTPRHEVYQQQPTSPILNQDQSGQVSAQTIQPHGHLMSGESHQPQEESVSQSPKLERPRSLSIQRSEESENLDKKNLSDIKSEAHSVARKAEAELDNIENDVEKLEIAESAPQLSATANNNAHDSDDSESRSKSPNPLTAQGFFDLKFYHSRLW